MAPNKPNLRRGLNKDDPEREEIKRALMRGDYGPKVTAEEIRKSRPKYKKKFVGGQAFQKSISRLRQEIRDEKHRGGLHKDDPEREEIKQAMIRGDYDPNVTSEEIRKSKPKYMRKFQGGNSFRKSISRLRQEIREEKQDQGAKSKKATANASSRTTARRQTVLRGLRLGSPQSEAIKKKTAKKTPRKKAQVSKSKRVTEIVSTKAQLQTPKARPSRKLVVDAPVPTRKSRRLASEAHVEEMVPKQTPRQNNAMEKSKAAAATAKVAQAAYRTDDEEEDYTNYAQRLAQATATLNLPVWVTPWQPTGNTQQQLVTITVHLLSGTSRDHYVFQVVDKGRKLKIVYSYLPEFCNESVLVVDASCTRMERDSRGKPTKNCYNKNHAKVVAATGKQIAKERTKRGSPYISREMTIPLPFVVEQQYSYDDPTTNVPVFSRLNLGDDAHNSLTFASIELVKRRSTVDAESAWNEVDISSATKIH